MMVFSVVSPAGQYIRTPCSSTFLSCGKQAGAGELLELRRTSARDLENRRSRKVILSQ